MTKHYRVVEIGKPTEKQSRNWFRTYKKLLPQNGEIVFFDRSWYSRALIQPTMRYCSDNQYAYFMKNVINWEKRIVEDGTILIKFYLSININTLSK